MRRAMSMAFAPGAMMFPGGGVDPRDADPSIPWSGGAAEEFAAPLDTDTARLVVAAALRELFEETGALLVDPISSRDLEEARRKVEARERSMGDLVVELGGAMDVAQLKPWMRPRVRADATTRSSSSRSCRRASAPVRSARRASRPVGSRRSECSMTHGTGAPSSCPRRSRC